MADNKKKAGELYMQWKKTGDRESWNELIHRLDPVIDNAVKNFADNDKSLKPRAYLLASEAVKNFDPEKNTRLNTHVYNQLQPLRREKNQRKQAVHIPENVRVDSSKVYGFTDKFRAEEGRPPSMREIADNLGMSYKRINKAMQVGKEKSPESLVTESGDIAVGEKPDYSKIWADYVYHDLDPVGQIIFEHKTGYKGRPILSNMEIAQKLKMSPSAVSQRSGKISENIQKGLQ